MWLLLAGVLAQLADAATMGRVRVEANPLVLHLGWSAYPAKWLLIAAAVCLWYSLPRLRGRWPELRSRTARLLASLLLLIGLVGTYSNLYGLSL